MNGVDADLCDDLRTSAIPARARSTSTSRRRISTPIPGLKEFVAEWAKSWGKDGLLAKHGMVVAPDDVQARPMPRSPAELTAARPLDGLK